MYNVDKADAYAQINFLLYSLLFPTTTCSLVPVAIAVFGLV